MINSSCKFSCLVIQWFLHCQQYVIRQVGCELDFLGDNLKEEKSLSDEVKDTSSENGVQEEKNAACFTNNRLNALYSIFIWWVKLYIWHLTNISNSWMWQKYVRNSYLFSFTLFSDQDEEKFLTRSDKHSYFHIIHIMVVRMKRSSWQEVSNTTGCLPRCSHTRYTWKLRKKSKVIHSSNNNLEVRKTI